MDAGHRLKLWSVGELICLRVRCQQVCELTVQLVDFGLGSKEGLLRFFFFVSHLLFELLLSALALRQLEKHTFMFSK